jgi:hypothetical protein
MSEGASPGSQCWKSAPLAASGAGAPHATSGRQHPHELVLRGQNLLEAHEQHCEVHFLLPQHERSMAQAHLE